MRIERIVAMAVLAGVALSGCGFGVPNMCEQRTDYKAVRQTAKIKVPAELDPIPDITQLEIPVSSTPPDEDQTCLEKPPRYFSEEGETGES